MGLSPGARLGPYEISLKGVHDSIMREGEAAGVYRILTTPSATRGNFSKTLAS